MKITWIFVCIVSLSEQFEIEIGLNNQYISGIFPDLNLCQIFTPISVENDNKIFFEAKPNLDVSKHVRYIVLHKCRWSSKQDSFYGPYLNKAFECEDTRFVQVSAILTGISTNLVQPLDCR